jgi:hypothetical protein
MNQNKGGKSLRDERFADEELGSGVSANVCRPIISSKIPFPSPSIFPAEDDAHISNADHCSETRKENNEPLGIVYRLHRQDMV